MSEQVDPVQARRSKQAFLMRQAKAAKAIGLSVREFVETYGSHVDWVPREADMDLPVVAHTLQNKRNEIETANMNPILKKLGLMAFDSVFSDKTQKGIQKWADMQYYWKSFADLFKSKGKRVMGQRQLSPGFQTRARRRLATDPRDEAGAIAKSRRFQDVRQESVLRDLVREILDDEEEKSKKKKKGKGWGNPAGPGVSSSD